MARHAKDFIILTMILTTVSKNKGKVIFFAEYLQKHNIVSSNPIERTLLTLARPWHSIKKPFQEQYIIVQL